MKWIVNTLGGPDREFFEISVVRESNQHGQRSYGWFGEDKLLISHNGGPCRWGVTSDVWERLIRVANETAEALNTEDTE